MSHNKYAPYWAAALVIFGGLGLATSWIDLGSFWRGYVLDMVGPAWNYILFRGLFIAKVKNKWTTFFSPIRTVIIFILVSFGIEILQFYEVYESTFDGFDFVAYVSLLIPMFIIDQSIHMSSVRKEN